MIPRKKVVQITEDLLPEPFVTYWNSEDRLERPHWLFYLVDDEDLYIKDSRQDDQLLCHWTHVGCCGVQLFLLNMEAEADENEKPLQRYMPVPFVRDNGEYLFMIFQDEVSLFAVSPVDGNRFVIWE